jgi:hypothetical protein
MKMGTIASLLPHEAAARHALGSASLRRSAILHCATQPKEGRRTHVFARSSLSPCFGLIFRIDKDYEFSRICD